MSESKFRGGHSSGNNAGHEEEGEFGETSWRKKLVGSLFRGETWKESH